MCCCGLCLLYYLEDSVHCGRLAEVLPSIKSTLNSPSLVAQDHLQCPTWCCVHAVDYRNHSFDCVWCCCGKPYQLCSYNNPSQCVHFSFLFSVVHMEGSYLLFCLIGYCSWHCAQSLRLAGWLGHWFWHMHTCICVFAFEFFTLATIIQIMMVVSHFMYHQPSTQKSKILPSKIILHTWYLSTCPCKQTGPTQLITHMSVWFVIMLIRMSSTQRQLSISSEFWPQYHNSPMHIIILHCMARCTLWEWKVIEQSVYFHIDALTWHCIIHVHVVILYNNSIFLMCNNIVCLIN